MGSSVEDDCVVGAIGLEGGVVKTLLHTDLSDTGGVEWKELLEEDEGERTVGESYCAV